MPRVNTVAKCRKSPGNCGKCGTKIEAGQAYKFWAFMVGGHGGPKHIRCGKPGCSPKPQDLTQSEFWSAIYSLQDTVFDGKTPEDLEDQRDDVKDELENIGSEQEDKYSNLPEGFQNGQSGELLQERSQACQDVASELESVDCEIEGNPEEPDAKDGAAHAAWEKERAAWLESEQVKDRLEEIRDALANALSNISCS